MVITYDDHDNSDSNNYLRNDCVHIEFIKLNLPPTPPTALFFGFRTHMLFPHDTPEQDSVDRHLKLIKSNMLGDEDLYNDNDFGQAFT